jgi:hypothetical protein
VDGKKNEKQMIKFKFKRYVSGVPEHLKLKCISNSNIEAFVWMRKRDDKLLIQINDYTWKYL